MIVHKFANPYEKRVFEAVSTLSNRGYKITRPQQFSEYIFLGERTLRPDCLVADQQNAMRLIVDSKDFSFNSLSYPESEWNDKSIIPVDCDSLHQIINYISYFQENDSYIMGLIVCPSMLGISELIDIQPVARKKNLTVGLVHLGHGPDQEYVFRGILQTLLLHRDLGHDRNG